MPEAKYSTGETRYTVSAWASSSFAMRVADIPSREFSNDWTRRIFRAEGFPCRAIPRSCSYLRNKMLALLLELLASYEFLLPKVNKLVHTLGHTRQMAAGDGVG